MKKSIQKYARGFSIIAAIFSITIFASAAEFYSIYDIRKSNWDENTYHSCSVLSLYSDAEGGCEVGGGINIYEENGKTIEFDAVRAQPRLYWDGELWLSEGWHYSNGTEDGMFCVDSTYYPTPSGKVYSQSVFGFYNGRGYTDYSTPATVTKDMTKGPYYRSVGVETIKKEFGVNENGQTYGAGLQDATPDLIKAVGMGGIRGYVYNSDLLSLGDKTSIGEEPSTIPNSIPLYAQDGTTVLGNFLIGRPNN